MSDEVQREIGTTIGTAPVVPTDDREKQPFELEHPAYLAMCPLIDRYEAVIDGLEADKERKKWLPQFPFELDDLYEARVKSTVFLGGSEVSVERLVGAVFASDPQITSTSEKVTAWLDNVDGEGTSLRDAMEEASGEANTDGIHYGLITKRGPMIDGEDGEVSKAQEEAAGETTARLELLDARNVPSWGMIAGRVVWAAVRQVVREAPTPTEKPKTIERWRVIDRDTTTLWERELKDQAGEEEKLEQVGEPIEHGLGRMPLVPLYGNRVRRFQGKSYIKAASRADIAKLREDSWGQQARNIHANPILALKSSRKLKEIWIGGNAVRLEADEELGYIPLDSGALDQRTDAAERYTREAVRVTGSNPTFTTDGLTFQGESGVAQRQRFSQTEQRYIKRHTRSLERTTIALMDLAYLILEDADEVPTDGETAVNSAQYFNTFEVLELDTLGRSYAGVAMSIESPTFHRTVQTQIALQMVGDASQAVKDQIRKEIEASDPIDDSEDDEGGEGDISRGGSTGS